MYGPVGGVISLTSAEVIGFCSRIGVGLDSFGPQKEEDRYDLRFTTTDLDIQAVREEFPRWGGEHHPETASRELVEELVDETAILTEADLTPFSLDYLHTKEEIALSDRGEGALTLRIASVFKLKTRQTASTRFMLATTRRDTSTPAMAYFASPEEIEANQTVHGAAIASVARFLLSS